MTTLLNRVFSNSTGFVQFAALPYRRHGSAMSICLVTSRGTGRLIIPKGWPERGKAPHKIAAKEAFEEAGLKGEIGKQPIGAFKYRKGLHWFASATCRVDVYPLLVTEEYEDWPESKQRERIWYGAKGAANAVREPELAKLIQRFSESR